MVLLSQVGGLASIGYAAWQALEDAIAAAKEDPKAPRAVDYGVAAASSGHAHIFEDFKKLPLNMRVQFIEDLAKLSLWSGQANKALKRKGSKPWKSLSMREKGHVLGALDWLSFDFVEHIKKQGEERADAWLWQLTESLPLLANEPLAMEQPVKELAELQRLLAPAQEAVQALLDARRAEQLGDAKEVVKPLEVAAAARNLQILKMLVEELGLQASACAAKEQDLKALLEPLQLVPEQQSLRDELEAAEKALQDEAEAAAAAVRDASMPGVEAAARRAFVSDLINSASADAVWRPAAATAGPGTKSNVVARQLAMVEVLLAELADSSDGEAGVAELVAAAQKLVPRVLPALALNEAPSPAAKEKDGEGQEEGEEAEEAAPAPPSPSAVVASLLAEVGQGEGAARAAASKLRAPLAEAAEKVLLKKPVVPSFRTSEEVVKDVVEAMFRQVLIKAGVAVDAEPMEREVVRKEVQEHANATSAREQQAALEKLEAEAAASRAKALAAGLAARRETAAEQPAAVRLMLGSHALSSALAAKSGLSAAVVEALLVVQDGDLDTLESGAATAARQARELADRLVLAADTARGLELGQGVTSLLMRLDIYLTGLQKKAEEAKPVAAEAEVAGDAAEEDGVAEAPAAATAAVPPAPEFDAAKITRAHGLVSGLLAEGLVLLELPGGSYKKLQSLRETVDVLQPAMDGLAWNRSITALKELVGQLGPIGAAVDARLGETEEESRRHLLVAVRAAAVDIYRCLQDLIAQDSSTRPEMLQAMASAKEAAFSMKVEKKVATLEGLLAKLDTLGQKREQVAGAAAKIPGSGAAEKALQKVQDQAGKLRGEVRMYMQYMRLREHALGSVPPACPPDIEVPEFPSLADAELDHAEDAVWMEMAAAEEDDLYSWCMVGYKLVARGQAAVLLMAGGLDGDVVRVTKDVGLPSTKPLLQLYAERLQRIQRLSTEALYGQGSGVVHPMQWYIMASPATEQPIRKFLQDNLYFGLEATQVHVFAPDLSTPMLNEEGKVALENPAKIARAPGGSGEVFRGLRDSGMLAHMQRSGVTCLDVHAVEDNIMARIADATFMGYCHSIGLDCAAKVIDPDAVQMTMYGYAAAAGVLTGGGGAEEGPVMDRLPHMMPAIGQYYFSMRWMKEVDSALQREPMAMYRLAPAVLSTRTGKAPGYRLDRHITDFVLGGGGLVGEQQSGLVVVEPSEEFSVVWGAVPFFAPDTDTAAVEDLLILHTSWVEAAGGSLADEEEGVIEVSPLVSYCGEELDRLVEGRRFEEAYALDLQGFATQPQGRSNVGPWILPFLAGYAVLAAMKVAKTLK